jgi:hypothetical protein
MSGLEKSIKSGPLFGTKISTKIWKVGVAAKVCKAFNSF